MEVATGREVGRWTRAGIARAVGGCSLADASLAGVAWSPSGRFLTFAHEFGGGVDLGGAAEARTAVLDRCTGGFRSRGGGAPVAWLDEDRILMRSDRSDRDGERVWVSSGRGRSRALTGVWAAGWDGRSIVLFRERRGTLVRETWDPALRSRPSAAPLPVLKPQDVNDAEYFER